MMITRYASSLGLGGAVTFGLLFVMQQMIATGHRAITGREPTRLPPYIRVETPPPTLLRQTRVTPPPTPAKPPELPPTGRGGDGVAVKPVTPTAPPFTGIVDTQARRIDGDLLPIVKVQPNYPATALRQGLDGYVIVQFTVTRGGTVTDVVVTESSHRVFERAAIQAASRFRYRPRVIDGEAVEVFGVLHLIRFAIED
jgi:protein TonB